MTSHDRTDRIIKLGSRYLTRIKFHFPSGFKHSLWSRHNIISQSRSSLPYCLAIRIRDPMTIDPPSGLELAHPALWTLDHRLDRMNWAIIWSGLHLINRTCYSQAERATSAEWSSPIIIHVFTPSSEWTPPSERTRHLILGRLYFLLWILLMSRQSRQSSYGRAIHIREVVKDYALSSISAIRPCARAQGRHIDFSNIY